MSFIDTAVAPVQVIRTGEFELPCTTDIAFPLFSPEGERVWIKEWDPKPVFPETIEFRQDTVFMQGQGAEEAMWTIVDADWEKHRAEYVRVAPGSHSAHIVVSVEPNNAGCRVQVRYTVTTFTDEGKTLLAGFSEEAYATKMQNWKRQITTYLTTRAA